MNAARPLLALVLATPTVTATAQTTSPLAVSERFLKGLAQARWSDAARLLDLDSFREYVDHFLSRSDQPGPDRPIPTVEDIRRRDPSIPREVAEWQVREMREAQQQVGDPTPYEFAGVRSAAELRRLRIEAAAARWLEARDPRYVIRRQLEELRCSVPDDPGVQAPARRVIGTVPDGDATAYAVYREEFDFGGPPAGGDLRVIELQLRRGQWLIQPRGDLLPEVSFGLEECPR